jgi:hypothetical protein
MHASVQVLHPSNNSSIYQTTKQSCAFGGRLQTDSVCAAFSITNKGNSPRAKKAAGYELPTVRLAAHLHYGTAQPCADYGPCVSVQNHAPLSLYQSINPPDPTDCVYAAGPA